jgi:hypothetical protein
MVKLGIANTRMKDFHDVWFLTRRFKLEEATLRQAIEATFAHSDTPETEEWAIEFGFSLRRSLRPKHILGHTHPAIIYDPLNHGAKYHNAVTSCAWCVAKSASRKSRR